MSGQVGDLVNVQGGARRVRLRQRDWLPYALIGPAIVLVATLAIYPALTALQVSLFDMNLLHLSEIRFVGLGNFQKLFEDQLFLGSVLKTLRWTGTIVAAQMAVGLPVALLLNEKFPGRGLVRTIVLVPWVVPPAVTAVLWAYMFDANFGVMNEMLVRLGLIPSYIAWSADPNGSFFILVLAMVWTGFPFIAIVLLAALQSLSDDIFEAARIDGAGAWSSFRYITLPQLIPTILLLLLLRGMWLSHHVDIIYLITDGGPGIANYTMSVYSFKLTSIEFNVGYASAVAVVLAFILLVASLFYIHYIEKSREYLT